MKKTLIIFLIIVLGVAGFLYMKNEPIPEPVIEENQTERSQADQLANKLLKAINKEAWDSIRFVQWSFRDKRHFVWDKYEHHVQVKWNEYEVLVDLNTEKGIVYEMSEFVNDTTLLRKAIDAFNNDSFWLNAPAKVYDYGTQRSVVDHDGKPALMVKYNSGGTTPGDSYLWILDDNGLPKAWKMWVSIIPVGGVENTWEEWESYNGAMVSQFHAGELFDLRISNIKTGQSLTELDVAEDLFAPLTD